MGVYFFLLRGPLKDVIASFSGYIFTLLAFKRYSIISTTKGGVSWWLSPVNSITNSYILNSQIIATNYYYTLLLNIFTEARNRIVPGFGGATKKGTGTTLFLVYFSKPQHILKMTFLFPPSIYYFPDFQNTYYIYILTWPYCPSIQLCCMC